MGGKTGVDIPEGKNLVGAFWQPRLVIVDTSTLETLPPAFFTDGVGEIVKYACIRDRELFDLLESGEALTPARLEETVPVSYTHLPLPPGGVGTGFHRAGGIPRSGSGAGADGIKGSRPGRTRQKSDGTQTKFLSKNG